MNADELTEFFQFQRDAIQAGFPARNPAVANAASDALNRGADRVEREGDLTLATFPGGVVEMTQTSLSGGGDYLMIHAPVPIEADTPNTWVTYFDNSIPLSALHHAKETGDEKWLDDVKKSLVEAGYDFDALLKRAHDEAEERKAKVAISPDDVEAARQAPGCSDKEPEAPKVETATLQVSGSELRRLKAFLNSLPETFFQDAYPVAGLGRLVSPSELIGNEQIGHGEAGSAF